MREVLELARRVEGLQGLEKTLQSTKPRLPIRLLLLGKNGMTPEDQLGHTRLCGDDFSKQGTNTLLDLRHTVVPRRRVDKKTLGHIEQFTKILERPEREIARSFEMLELRDL